MQQFIKVIILNKVLCIERFLYLLLHIFQYRLGQGRRTFLRACAQICY